jgi:hypothetical protein
LAWATAVEKGLDILDSKRKLGGAAVHHHADTTAMTFSPGANTKEGAKRISHGSYQEIPMEKAKVKQVISIRVLNKGLLNTKIL